jgi:hypothetical protein
MKPYYGWLAIGLGVGIILLAIGQWTLWHRISTDKKPALAATIISLSSPSNAPFADPVPDGNGPYTLTKLEWLAMELNGHAHRYSMGSDGFVVNCQAHGSNTIRIEVLYYEDMTNNIAQKRRESAMDSVKTGLTLRCQAHGWDWVNTSEVYTKWPLELAGLPVELLPYVPTRSEWSAMVKLVTAKRALVGD